MQNGIVDLPSRYSVPETLAAVLKGEVDLEPVPAPARPMVERCLREDPRRRWQAIGDARIAIEEALAGSATGTQVPKKSPTRLRLMWAAAGAIAVLIAWITVSFQAIRAAVANPAKALRSE